MQYSQRWRVQGTLSACNSGPEWNTSNERAMQRSRTWPDLNVRRDYAWTLRKRVRLEVIIEEPTGRERDGKALKVRGLFWMEKNLRRSWVWVLDKQSAFEKESEKKNSPGFGWSLFRFFVQTNSIWALEKIRLNSFLDQTIWFELWGKRLNFDFFDQTSENWFFHSKQI